MTKKRLRNYPIDRIKRSLISLLVLILALPSLASGVSEDSAQVYFSHALKSKQEGNLMAAESLLRRAIDLEPENSDFHFELGSLYAERGRLERARQEFEQTLMIQPSHLAARYNLGLVYRELGFMSEARSEFRKVLELDPSNVKAQLQIGYIYQAEGFVEEARQVFERAREMDATDPEPEYALEDLAAGEERIQARSRAELNRSFQRNQQLLYRSDSQPGSYPSSQGFASNPNTQLSQKNALVQAGIVLFQELLAKRSQARSENEE